MYVPGKPLKTAKSLKVSSFLSTVPAIRHCLNHDSQRQLPAAARSNQHYGAADAISKAHYMLLQSTDLTSFRSACIVPYHALQQKKQKQTFWRTLPATEIITTIEKTPRCPMFIGILRRVPYKTGTLICWNKLQRNKTETSFLKKETVQHLQSNVNPMRLNDTESSQRPKSRTTYEGSDNQPLRLKITGISTERGWRVQFCTTKTKTCGVKTYSWSVCYRFDESLNQIVKRLAFQS